MPLHLWLAFVAATVVLLVIPGPTILTVISYSIAHGRRANVPLVAGVALGDSTALVLSLLGIGSLLAASALWFSVVKWIGGLYLIYLGFRMLRASFGAADEGAKNGEASSGVANPSDAANAANAANSAAGTANPAAPVPMRLFLNTYAVTALNPKGIVFFIAFMPQFLAPDRPTAPQLWVMAVTFVVLATINATLYAVFAGAARRALSTPRARRRFERVGGSLLVAAGLWALAARRT